MQTFVSISELRNGKRYNTGKKTTMSESSSSKGSRAVNSHETSKNEGPEIRALTQEEVNEQVKSSIVFLTRQLEDLTQLVHE